MLGCETNFFQALISAHSWLDEIYMGAYIALTAPFINTPLQRGVGAAGARKTVLTVLSPRHFNTQRSASHFTSSDHVLR